LFMCNQGLNHKQVAIQADMLNLRLRQKDYFAIAIIAPQLMVQIIDLISQDFLEWADRKGFTRIPIEEMQVNELIVKLEKQDSDRLIISRAFAGLFKEEQDKNPNALKDFKSNFQKIESLISLRNRFAHEYFQVDYSSKATASIAQGGIELVNKLISRMGNA